MRTFFGALVALIFCVGALVPSAALAQSAVPDRQIPPTVLNEVRLLENRFDVALSTDCDESRCFSKGCTYVDHAVADRPRTSTLPGLGQDQAPSAVDVQEYLTQASCAFTHEDSVESKDVRALARRLQDKMSTGWLVVSVTHQRLRALPDYLQDPAVDSDVPDTDEPEPVVEPEPEPVPPWSLSTAVRELWSHLLPHLFWMVGLVLATIVALILIWAWRRVGTVSIEDQMLLAELGRGTPDEPTPVTVEVDSAFDEAAFVEEQDAAWRERLAAEGADPELHELVRALLRTRDFDLLAQAVLRFPATLPAAFPAGAVGGEIAAAKLAFSEHLKEVDADSLPDDATFFRRLNRQALSASVAAQPDAATIRALHEDFGAAGLGDILGALPPRPAALLFALAPPAVQDELVRMLEPATLAGMADMLLRSNRMGRAESQHLFEILSAARDEAPLPPTPTGAGVTDRGETFDAAAPLSVLLEALHPDRRAALFKSALERSHGSLADWTRGILVSDMLLVLHPEARADLFLGVDVEPLAAWISLLDRESAARLTEGLPSALRSSLQASSFFASRGQQLALAGRGRSQLAAAFQTQLARLGVSFSQVLVTRPGGAS